MVAVRMFSILGGSTEMMSAGMPFATRRDFMNAEMTTIRFICAIAWIRRRCVNTRLRAAFHARHAGAQRRQGHTPPGRVQLCFSGV